jgi:hypothetical protein
MFADLRGKWLGDIGERANRGGGNFPRTDLFPTRLLTSEDEYKWYWHQMIYFPETINTISTMNTMTLTHSLVSS